MILYAVDPGVKRCAVARFVDGVLACVSYTDFAIAPMHSCARGIVELPQVYRGARNAADLVDLAYAAGRVMALLPTKTVLPREWKGQVPCTCSKKVTVENCTHHRRMWAVLSDSERNIVLASKAAAMHNIYDAVALGLVELGRV